MKLVKILLAFCLNWIIIYVLFKILTFGASFIIPNLAGSEKNATLIIVYNLGSLVGIIISIISFSISKKIYSYVWNWKKKHTIRLTFDDGRDVEEPLSDGGRRKDLN